MNTQASFVPPGAQDVEHLVWHMVAELVAPRAQDVKKKELGWAQGLRLWPRGRRTQTVVLSAVWLWRFATRLTNVKGALLEGASMYFHGLACDLWVASELQRYIRSERWAVAAGMQ